MAQKDIMYLLSDGLPDLPVGLPDEQYGLVAPIYRGLVGFVQQVATKLGAVDYTQTALQEVGITELCHFTESKKVVVTAIEAVGYGKLVSLVTGTGYTEAHCRLAGNTTYMAHGICLEPNGIALGQKGRVILFSGLVTGLAGLTPGTVYWLGGSGLYAATNPGGTFQQRIGIAPTSSSLMLNISW